MFSSLRTLVDYLVPDAPPPILTYSPENGGDKDGRRRSSTLIVDSPIDDSLRLLKRVDFFRNYMMTESRKMKELVCPFGVYVVPRPENWLIWDGVIFVNAGCYSSGVFRFQLLLDKDYPYVRPNLKFISPPFHPYVDSKGFLQLHRRFPIWKVNENFIFHILGYLKECLYQVQTDEAAANFDASYYLTNDPDEFDSRAAVSVRKSKENILNSWPPGLPTTPNLQDTYNEDEFNEDEDDEDTSMLILTEIDEDTTKVVLKLMKKFTDKVLEKPDEKDVELWLPDFLEEMQETVKQ